MQQALTLTGQHVHLRPLTVGDADALVAAASDGELWKLRYTVVPSRETVAAYIQTALEGQAAGTVIPFVTESVGAAGQPAQVIGSTRFWKLDRLHRAVEIGHTWLAASWQRTAVNTEAKYLMLQHAFEQLNCIRVQFQTDEINEKSRAAILRLGTTQEGLLRNERIMPDGRYRNTVVFSLLDSEWPAAKAKLEARLAAQP